MIEIRPNLRGVRAIAPAVFTGALLTLLPAAPAQMVKAPRYQSSVDAPSPRLNLPALPPAITPHGVVVEDVVVRVNDNIISRSDVERAAQQMAGESETDKLSPAETTQRERDMLRDMIDQQLLLSKAKELGLNADADVIRRLDDIRKQNKMDSLDDLEKAARAQGVSFEDFKAQIRNQILTQQVVRDEVGRRLQISQGEEQKFYDEHKSEFNQPEQIRLSEILVPLGENATPAEIAAAEAKANGLKSQVAAGGDFAEIAKKSSGGPSAAQGGELGLFKRGALAKVLEDQTFDLKVGESTQPVRTRQGFVILKVTEHQQAGPAPLTAVQPQIQEAMYMQQMQPALRAYLTRLREESYIDLQPGFVDSGASVRETKPVFTAYAPPAPKKKKVIEKARFDRHGSVTPAVASPDTGARTLTGAEAKTAVDPATGLAVLPATSGARGATIARNGKTKKVRREKVRFGQAPRDALPAGPAEVAVGGDTPSSTAATPAGSAEMASAGAGDLSSNPLAPVAPERTKTRFAAHAKEVKEEKVKTLSAKQQEKISAKPAPMTSEEKTQTQTQAAPLGLSGDTAKKKKVKKPKHVKGTPKPQRAPKERLQDKPAEAKTPAPDPIAPTVSPALAPDASTPESTRPNARPATAPQTPPNSSVPRSVPNQPDTTLPPVTQPTPGSPQQGQPVPGTQPPA